MILLTSLSSGTSSKFPPEGLTLEWYSRLGDQKQFMEAFRNSILASAGAVLLALITGTLAALAIVHYSFPGRGLLRAFFMSPMVMPKITLGVAYLILFSKMHIAGGLFALILGEAVIVLPFVLSIVGSALANLNPAHREAAADLGAGPFRIFSRLRCRSCGFHFFWQAPFPLSSPSIRLRQHCLFCVREITPCLFSSFCIWKNGRILRLPLFPSY